jgi:hypothetical protein
MAAITTTLSMFILAYLVVALASAAGRQDQHFNQQQKGYSNSRMRHGEQRHLPAAVDGDWKTAMEMVWDYWPFL